MSWRRQLVTSVVIVLGNLAIFGALEVLGQLGGEVLVQRLLFVGMFALFTFAPWWLSGTRLTADNRLRCGLKRFEGVVRSSMWVEPLDAHTALLHGETQDGAFTVEEHAATLRHFVESLPEQGAHTSFPRASWWTWPTLALLLLGGLPVATHDAAFLVPFVAGFVLLLGTGWRPFRAVPVVNVPVGPGMRVTSLFTPCLGFAWIAGTLAGLGASFLLESVQAPVPVSLAIVLVSTLWTAWAANRFEVRRHLSTLAKGLGHTLPDDVQLDVDGAFVDGNGVRQKVNGETLVDPTTAAWAVALRLGTAHPVTTVGAVTAWTNGDRQLAWIGLVIFSWTLVFPAMTVLGSVPLRLFLFIASLATGAWALRRRRFLRQPRCLIVDGSFATLHLGDRRDRFALQDVAERSHTDWHVVLRLHDGRSFTLRADEPALLDAELARRGLHERPSPPSTERDQLRRLKEAT